MSLKNIYNTLKQLFFINFLLFFFPPQKEPKSANIFTLYLGMYKIKLTPIFCIFLKIILFFQKAHTPNGNIISNQATLENIKTHS